jgi:glycosyltransferase involved in cell wall biosynthesis
MRVVIHATPLVGHRTGVGHYTAELIRALAGTGQVRVSLYPRPALAKVRVWFRGGPKPVDPSAGTDARRSLWRRIVRIPFRWGWRAMIETEARLAFHPRRVDLYHEPNFFPLRTRLPTVVTVHDLSAVLHPEWHPADRVKLFETEFLPRIGEVAHVLTDSDQARAEIIRTLNLPAQRVTRAYPGVRPSLRPLPATEVAPVLHRLGLPPTYFLHVGTLEPRKNLLMLMRAYTAIPADLRERCPLVLVGPWGWRFEELAGYFDSEARHRNVIHLGYVEEADLAAVYNGAKALVFPTWYEGFGLPAAEMLACGGAVIASTDPAVGEVLGPCGTRIDPADEAGWRDAIARAIRDPDWVATMRTGGIERAGEFTWSKCAGDTIRAYRAALRVGLDSDPVGRGCDKAGR